MAYSPEQSDYDYVQNSFAINRKKSTHAPSYVPSIYQSNAWPIALVTQQRSTNASQMDPDLVFATLVVHIGETHQCPCTPMHHWCFQMIQESKCHRLSLARNLYVVAHVASLALSLSHQDLGS